jgi:hypothetical protein
MQNSNDTIGNRTRDLAVCSAVPQPNAPPRASRQDIFALSFQRLIKYLLPFVEVLFGFAD